VVKIVFQQYRSTEASGNPLLLRGHAGQVTAVRLPRRWHLGLGRIRRHNSILARRTRRRALTPVNAIAIASNTILAGCADGHVRVFNADANETAEIELGGSSVVAIAAVPGGHVAAARFIDGRVMLLDPQTKRVILSRQSPGKPVWTLAFAQSGGGDGLARHWDTATGEPIGAGIADNKKSCLPNC
jgi:WD40 repeat protein